MDRDQVWQTIDGERASLADLLDDLEPDEWEAPSLCAGWRVRDVAAHLTQAHMGVLPALVAAVRARGSFDRMIHDTAVREARLPVEQFAPRLRAMVGSRRKVVGLTELEPLIDVLLHGQDIAVPLGRRRTMPPEAAAAAATRVWASGQPWHARKRLAGLRFTATDTAWSAGDGAEVRGPVAALLMALSARPAALPALSGPGLAELQRRLPTGARTPVGRRADPGAQVIDSPPSTANVWPVT